MPTEMLSQHFSLSEMTVSDTAARKGISNQPATQAHYDNLKRTANVMELVRHILMDKPIIVTSGYRSPEVNAAVGGATNSAHCSGLACDFTCPGFGTPHEVCKALEPHMEELGIDQIIWEYDSWTHLGLSANPPRHMALTINNSGTTMGIA